MPAAFIPDELAQRPQWLVWRMETRVDKKTGEKKPTKVPYQSRSPRRGADSTDPKTWSTLEQARSVNGNADGIGFVLSSDDPYVFIDLDKAVDENGKAKHWAAGIIRQLNSYTELSPSGTGFHIVLRGRMPGNRHTKAMEAGGKIEIYETERYMTFTGRSYKGFDAIQDRQEALESFYAEHWPPRPVKEPPRPPELVSVQEDEILDLARNAGNGDAFWRLWNGDTSSYDGDDSRADLGLCCKLAFWCQGDPALIDSMFRKSALLRDKWDERRGATTYGLRTINAALDIVTEYYTPRKSGGEIRHGGERYAAPVTAAPAIKAEPFPLDVLPEAFKNWVTSTSEALQCQPDVMATFGLAAISAAVGASREIVLKNSWSELPSLWTAVVGPPGLAKKTPALKVAMRPLHQWQAERAREYEKAKADHKIEMARWKDAPKAERGPQPTPPRFVHLFVNDITTEKLGDVLAETPRGVLMVQDELLSWIEAMNQYKGGRGNDRQRYLSIWSSDTIKVDRKSTEDPVYVKRPCLTITGGIQPSVVGTLRRDRADDGLFERILWCWPELPKHYGWNENEIDQDVAQAYHDLIYTLLEIQMEPQFDELAPVKRHLSEEARQEWQRLYDEHMAKIANDLDSASLLAKIPGQAAKLALNDYMIRYASRTEVTKDIEVVSVRAGWALANYYVAHGTRVLGLVNSTPEDVRGDRLLAWIQKQGGTVSHRDVVRNQVANIRRSSAAEAALEDLADRGFGVVERGRKQGGRSVVFRLSVG